MRSTLADALHAVLRRIPGVRNVYAQRDSMALVLAGRDDEVRRLREEARGLEAQVAEALARIPPPRADDRFWTMMVDGRLGAAAGYLVELAADGPFGASGTRLAVPFDDVMMPYISRRHAWQHEEIDFVAARMGDGAGYQVLDIGANIGLFSRQVALRLPRLAGITCIEADPGNFGCLAHNLACLPRGLASLHNVALSDHAGETTWFRDNENFGNFSLNPDAVRDRPHTALRIATVDTAAFLAGPVGLEPAARLIWKSDTQGYDELIISRTPQEVWDRVDFAIVELWRIAKPAYDRDVFARRIEAFPNRAIGTTTGVGVADVLAYLDATDVEHDDLYLWR